MRQAKISLNDNPWSSKAARAKGMRRVAIAQLGSNKLDQVEFAQRLAKETIRVIVPIALRAAAKLQKDEKHVAALNESALLCETAPTCDSALIGRKAAYAAYAAAAAAYADAAAAECCATVRRCVKAPVLP